MYSLYGQYPCRYWGFPIRKSTDHNLFAVPRGLSQPITSFFGSQWQGIHPVLFLAWPSVCSASFWQTPQKTLISFSLFRGAERCSVRFYCFLLSSFCSLDVHKYAYRSKKTILCSKISQKMRFMILCIIISIHITILWICSLELSEFLR